MKDLFVNIDDITSSSNTERKSPSVESNSKDSLFFNPSTVDSDSSQNVVNKLVDEVPAANNTRLGADKAELSGEANAYLHAGLQESVLKFAVLVRYVTRFNDAEKERILQLESIPLDQRSEYDISLSSRFLKYTESFNRMNDKVATTSHELDMLKQAYTIYAEISGKETSPAVIIASTVVNGLVNKLMDIFVS